MGLARYPKPTGFTDMANAANERDGNLPDFRQIFARYFPSSPLQGSQIPLRISQTRLSAETFDPACLYLQSEAVFTTLKRTDATGAEYIHQILTDDAFTLIEKLAPVAPDVGSGFRVRVWKRNASPLNLEPSYYTTSGFDLLTPLTDATFKRGAADDSTLLYVLKKQRGVGPQEVLTNQIVQTLDGSGRPDTVTSTLYQGEGAVAGLTKLREEVAAYTYPAAGGRAWDYTIVRTVKVAPVDVSGALGGTLVLTAKTQEVYQDFSPPARKEKGVSQQILTGKSSTTASQLVLLRLNGKDSRRHPSACHPPPPQCGAHPHHARQAGGSPPDSRRELATERSARSTGSTSSPQAGSGQAPRQHHMGERMKEEL